MQTPASSYMVQAWFKRAFHDQQVTLQGHASKTHRQTMKIDIEFQYKQNKSSTKQTGPQASKSIGISFIC